VAGDVVYAVGNEVVRCLDLNSGSKLGEITAFDSHGPRSNPCLLVAGDKLLLSPEGQHGVQSFMLFDVDPGKLTQLRGTWHPPHQSTTAYASQPIVNPVVDGRLFVRGLEGIYCYDLRRCAEAD
jgi:hypothetical protein